MTVQILKAFRVVSYPLNSRKEKYSIRSTSTYERMEKWKKSFLLSLLPRVQRKGYYFSDIFGRLSLPYHIPSLPYRSISRSKQAFTIKSKVHRLIKDTENVALSSEGCGGVYLIRDPCIAQSSDNSVTDIVAVFKPRNEEFMAPGNPRGFKVENAILGITEHPVRKGFKIGDGAVREYAAYLLDKEYGNFSGVPVTTLLTLNGKEGSLQEYIPNISSAEDMGTGVFGSFEVHKVGILDIRLMNNDRHAGNILLSSPEVDQDEFSTYQMTPIDHGFCLPSYQNLADATFDWLYWPQAKLPFHAEALDHIASIDIEKDAKILRSCGIDEDCVTTMRLTTQLLKIGASRGMNLHEIGLMLHRSEDATNPSRFEMALEDVLLDIHHDLQNASLRKRWVGDLIVKAMEKKSYEIMGQKVRSKSCAI